MGWDAAIFGTVKLAAKPRAAWLAGTADSESVGGAKLAGARFGPTSVAATIAALQSAGLTHLALVTAKTPVTIAAIATEDDYLDWAPAISALFAAAFARGGTGEVVYCGLEGAAFAYVQTAAGIAALTGAAVAAIDRRRELKRLYAIYEGELDDSGERGPAPAGKTWMLNPFTKKPMRVPSSAVTDAKLVRAALLRAGFDPDTGKAIG